MPGIAGIVSQRPANECESLVSCMVTSMKHERFDTSGMYAAPDMGIYGGWVAHENSFAAAQVFFNERKDIALLFSGECFMDPQTRSKLREKRHEVGETAGSWLVHFYEEEGDRFFEKLNGIFSGLLIDKRQSKAFLFNDRYGLERIYLCETKDATYFASEAKALLQLRCDLRAFDENGVAQYLAFGCTTGERTLFRNISLLPAGSNWTLAGGAIQSKMRYFTPDVWEAQEPISPQQFDTQFSETFLRIIPRYTEGESVGISLTGGLDTRLIMASRRKMVRQPICYTYDGLSGETLDTRLAARVAEVCGMDHEVLRIGADFFLNFSAHADRTVFLTDGTCGVLNAHEAYLSAKARYLASVRLTGVFGSEIMRGVSTFKPLQLSPRLLIPELRTVLSSEAKRPRPNGAEHPVSFAAFAEIPWSIYWSLAACRSQLTFRTPYLDNELVALAYRAPAGLRTSSLPALHLLEQNDPAIAAIPTDMGWGGSRGLGMLWRRLLSKATFKLDYLSNEGLPHSLSPLDDVLNWLNSRKMLFGHHKYLRYRSWMRKELAQYLRDSLAACDSVPFLNAGFVRGLAEQHITGRRNYICEINAVLTLSAVERTLLRPPV